MFFDPLCQKVLNIGHTEGKVYKDIKIFKRFNSAKKNLKKESKKSFDRPRADCNIMKIIKVLLYGRFNPNKLSFITGLSHILPNKAQN